MLYYQKFAKKINDFGISVSKKAVSLRNLKVCKQFWTIKAWELFCSFCSIKLYKMGITTIQFWKRLTLYTYSVSLYFLFTEIKIGRQVYSVWNWFSGLIIVDTKYKNLIQGLFYIFLNLIFKLPVVKNTFNKILHVFIRWLSS